jgi:hypothetical protein
MTRQWRAGTATVDVSPREGVHLGGYPHHPRPNKGIHDPLYASCLYLDDGGVQLAIVCADVLSVSKASVRAIREAASAPTGIPPANIMVCCSHSHSSPRAMAWMNADEQTRGGAAEAEYAERLNEHLRDVVVEAARAAVPARIGIEKGFCGREQGVGGNRRDPMGIADPEVWTIGVQDRAGNWQAALVKYALHPTVLHEDNLLVSADYPGYIRRHLDGTKPGMAFLFAQGTCGNQSSRYFRSAQTFAEAERIGTAIGTEADRVLDAMTLSAEAALCVRSTQVDIALRSLPDRATAQRAAADLRQAWESAREAGLPAREVWNAELRFLGAESTLRMVEHEEGGGRHPLRRELPVEVQVIGIGDTRIVGIQGELFVEFGIAIQYRAPFAKSFVISLANGALPGYAATGRAYAAGGYETGTSLLTGRSGDQLVDAAVGLLRETR